MNRSVRVLVRVCAPLLLIGCAVQGQPFEKVTKDTERDYFMSADEAKAYNIVDRVIEHH